MYLFLLVFGVVLSVAGVVLAASGLSVHDQDASVWVMGGHDCDLPCDPEPTLTTDSIYPGVFL